MLEPPRWIVGVDIGGTNLRAGMVPASGGEPVAVMSGPTRAEEGAQRVARRTVEMIRASMDAVGEGALGVGIGVPGPLDRDRGIVIEAPNLGWRDLPLRDIIASRTGLPAALDNDANCAAYGEWWLGAGRGAKRLIGLTLGTGIGGGVVLGGEIYHGASGAAGEVGHMSVHYAGRPCACGSRGCVEAYASGSGIAARAVEGLGAAPESALAALVRQEPRLVTAEVVCDAADAGDRYAGQVLEETARILAVAVANLVHLFNPDVIVIGGGVASAGDRLFEPLRAEVGRRTFKSAMEACRIVPAALPDTAGMIGAAAVLKRALHGSL